MCHQLAREFRVMARKPVAGSGFLLCDALGGIAQQVTKRKENVFVRGIKGQDNSSNDATKEHRSAGKMKSPDVLSKGLRKNPGEPPAKGQPMRAFACFVNFAVGADHQVFKIGTRLRRDGE